MLGLGGIRHPFFYHAIGCCAQSRQLLPLNDTPGNDNTVSVKLTDLRLCEHAPTFRLRKHHVLSAFSSQMGMKQGSQQASYLSTTSLRNGPNMESPPQPGEIS